MAAGIPIRDLFVQIGLDVDEKALTDFDKRLTTTKSNMRSLGKFLLAGAASIGVFLNEAGKFEQTTIAFETMLGSAEEAQALLKDMADFAAKTPFTLPGVESAAKQLLAVGIESDKMIDTLKSLGDVSAGLSVPLSRLALNFGQVKTQGKLTGRELRDFAIAGVPLADELAKQLNISKSEVAKLVSAGKIGFPEVEKAFISMTSEGGRFFDLMDKQSKSFFGIMSNILDVLILQARAIGKGLLPQAKELAKEFLKFIEANKELIKTRATKFFREIGKAVIVVIKALGFILTAVVDITEAFGGLEKVTKILLALWLTMIGLNLLSLIGSATTAVWALVSAVRAAGVAATLTNAAFLFIPVAIGIAVVALGLIFEDIFSFFTGKDSITGVIIDAFQNKFPRAFKVAKAALDILLAPIKVLFSLIGAIKKGLEDLAGGKPIFELGGGKSPATIAANIARQSAGIESTSPSASPSSGLINNKSNVITLVSKPEINVNPPAGSSPEDIAVAVGEEIDKRTGSMLRDAQQDTKSNEEF